MFVHTIHPCNAIYESNFVSIKVPYHEVTNWENFIKYQETEKDRWAMNSSL